MINVCRLPDPEVDWFVVAADPFAIERLDIDPFAEGTLTFGPLTVGVASVPASAVAASPSATFSDRIFVPAGDASALVPADTVAAGPAATGLPSSPHAVPDATNTARIAATPVRIVKVVIVALRIPDFSTVLRFEAARQFAFLM